MGAPVRPEGDSDRNIAHEDGATFLAPGILGAFVIGMIYAQNSSLSHGGWISRSSSYSAPGLAGA